MSYKRSLQERLLALALAGVTTFSLVPTQALAEAADALTSPQDAAAQVAAVDDSDDEEAGLGEPSAGASSVDEQAEDGSEQPDLQPSDASSDGGFAAGTSDAVDSPAPSEESADAAGENAIALASAAALNNAAAASSDETTTLSSNAKVFIQTEKDYAYSGSYTRYGALQLGETIYANMFDGASSYSLSSVSNPGTWTYTWLAGTTASSSNVSDYTEVVGTDQALTITADMKGKYLICKVTADGTDYYGPSVTYGSGINANYIPGPVLGEGQAELYSVKLSNSAPSVGDTLTVTAYIDYNKPAGDDVDVTYAWSYSDSKYSGFTTIEGATGNTFTVTEACKGKYVKVTASAGANEKYVTTSSAVLAEGAVTLAGVELTAASTEVGATLTAKAYTGSSYSPTYVDNSNVTYTWKKYKGSSAPSSYTTWETVEGESGPTLTVTDDLEGYYITVSANAGANDVIFGSYSTGYGVGPFKLAGAVDIYSAILAPEGSTSGTYVYTVDQTVQALAKEKGASDYIDSSKLTYQWQVSNEKSGTYTDIADATQSTLSLAGYQGKFVRCVVKSKIGSSEYTTRATNAIAAAGSVNVTKVALDVSSKVEAGKTITATATASGTDVTANEKVSWSWYWGDASGSCTNKIDGETGNTFAPDAATYAGKYIQARANGGFGDEKSNAVAVVEAGSVELYGVTVSGAQTSGAVQVGATLTAKATKGNSYTSVESADTVHYQWQYASSRTSSDSSFANITGAADSATYVVDASMVGNYIRVIATSENSVKSTQSKSYYGSTTSVDPVGPVTLAGQYKLASVAPAEVTTSTLTVGTTLTPSVKIQGSSSYSTSPLPSDAKLTLTWYTSDDGKTWAELTDGVDAKTGALTLSESLVGKYVKVTACSLDNTVEWASKAAVTEDGTYDLLRVITSPQINSSTTNLVTGDTVAASAQAKRVDGSTTNGIDVTSKVAFAWYAVDADGNDTLLEGLDGPSIQVPEAAAGKTLKVVATSGASSAELASANTVTAKDSLAGAVQQLKNAGKNLSVAYSADGANINDLLKKQLAELGYADIDVHVKSVKFSSTDKNATVGISTAADDTNGDVEFFYIDPNAYTGYSIDGLRRATVTFELARDGETVEYAPSKTAEIAWDEAKLQSLLDDAAKNLAITYSTGDSAESVTNAVTLPYRTGSASKIAVTWTSSDASAIAVNGTGWSNYTGKVTRFSADRNVTLTATVKLVSGNETLSATADFLVTVKADPTKVEAEKAELQTKLDSAFTYESVTYSGTETVAAKDGLTADLQMPRPATIGVDGKEYSVTYSASSDDVAFNGYKGTVYQPQAGDGAAQVKLTCTVTSKENSEVSVSKTLDYVIAPQDADDLARELKLMEAAKAGYAAAILNGQDASAVTSDMHAFQKAYLDADGNLAWAYNTTDSSAAGSGIVPVELEGYDDMGTQGWRLFKSSDSSVVSHENLLVAQPEYNTKVTVTSRLSSEKYARYAERYPDNETYAKLVNQDVYATVTVVGTTGTDDPDEGKPVVVTVEVLGPDAEGNTVEWVAETTVELAASTKMDAATFTKQVLEASGMTCDDGMYTISAKGDGKLPNGDASLGYVVDAEGNWSWWVFYINGEVSNLLATNYTVRNGDHIVWYFGDGTQQVKHTVSFQTGEGSSVSAQKVVDGECASRPVDPVRNGYAFGGWFSDEELTKEYNFATPVKANVTLYAKWDAGSTLPDDLPDWDSDWCGYNGVSHVTDAKVPTKDAEDKWAPVSLKDSDDWNTSVSDPVLAGDYLFIAVGNKLLKKNVDTGETVEGGEAVLDGSIDSTSRIVYTDGLILVPLSEGRLEAVNAATMAKVWVTDALPAGDHGAPQSLSSVTIRDGYAYFGTAEADWTTSYAGNLLCVRLSDGAVMWNKASETQSGYYWAGMAFSGEYGVIADDSGTVKVVDAATGDVVSSLKIADRVRTTVVSDGSYVYVASNDGVLHKLTVAEDGTLTENGKVAFGFSSTSTPVLANGKIIVGGTSTEGFTGGYQGKQEYHYGQIAVIDAATLTVEYAVNKADGSYIRQYGYDGGGDVKSCPVVSVQDGETYIYFTSNNEPGCAYRYRVGDAEAEVLYTPSTDGQNYCMASIIVGSDGALYYTNDSGKLFAIKGNGQRLRRFTVTFDANGKDASVPAAQKVREGTSAIEPATAPSCGGYKFLGWYTDAAGTTAWNFSDPVTHDMTLYAKWEKKGPTDPDDGESGNGNGGSGGDTGNGGSSGSINLTGNGSATGASAKSALAIAMNAQSTATEEETTVESLLAGFASVTATGTSSVEGELGSASEGARGVAEDTGYASASAGIPVWPFVGIGAAIAALIAVLATKRRKEEE